MPRPLALGAQQCYWENFLEGVLHPWCRFAETERLSSVRALKGCGVDLLLRKESWAGAIPGHDADCSEGALVPLPLPGLRGTGS